MAALAQARRTTLRTASNGFILGGTLPLFSEICELVANDRVSLQRISTAGLSAFRFSNAQLILAQAFNVYQFFEHPAVELLDEALLHLDDHLDKVCATTAHERDTSRACVLYNRALMLARDKDRYTEVQGQIDAAALLFVKHSARVPDAFIELHSEVSRGPIRHKKYRWMSLVGSELISPTK